MFVKCQFDNGVWRAGDAPNPESLPTGVIGVGGAAGDVILTDGWRGEAALCGCKNIRWLFCATLLRLSLTKRLHKRWVRGRMKKWNENDCYKCIAFLAGRILISRPIGDAKLRFFEAANRFMGVTWFFPFFFPFRIWVENTKKDHNYWFVYSIFNFSKMFINSLVSQTKIDSLEWLAKSERLIWNDDDRLLFISPWNLPGHDDFLFRSNFWIWAFTEASGVDWPFEVSGENKTRCRTLPPPSATLFNEAVLIRSRPEQFLHKLLLIQVEEQVCSPHRLLTLNTYSDKFLEFFKNHTAPVLDESYRGFLPFWLIYFLCDISNEWFQETWTGLTFNITTCFRVGPFFWRHDWWFWWISQFFIDR